MFGKFVQTCSRGALGHTYVWIFSAVFSRNLGRFWILYKCVWDLETPDNLSPDAPAPAAAHQHLFHSSLIWDSGHKNDLIWSLWTCVLCCRAMHYKFDASGRSSGPLPSMQLMHVQWFWSLSEAKGLMCVCFTVHTHFNLGNSVYWGWFCPHWSPQMLLSALRVRFKCLTSPW